MGEIKSAWEKVLERTENIQAQRKSMIMQNIINEGKRTAFKFIEQDGVYLENLKSKLASYNETDRNSFISGMVKVLCANLVMPNGSAYTQECTSRIQQALSLCSQEEAPYIEDLFQQLTGFFQQYTQNKDMIKENLQQQLLPQIREKNEKISAKLGVEVEIDVENDPDFKKALFQAYRQLDEKYTGVLQQVKNEIESRLIHN